MSIYPQHRATPLFLARGRDVRAPFPIVFTLVLAVSPAWSGDILRGGSAASVRQSDPSIGASVAAQQQARASQQDAMAKTALSLNAVRAMQTQARAISIRNGANNAGADPNHPGLLLPNFPNGLGPGALQLQGVPTGTMIPVQSQLGGLTNVTIKQTAQQALLNWETFNVGRDTTLTFDQSAGGASVSQWIAFNRITDPSGRPSQILGRINADGQVYIINQNGIIFGGASQVNARTLVASSLPVNDNLIQRGLLNNTDSQFLFSALPLPAGAKGTPAFTPPPSFLPDNRRGDVTVQEGAVLSSPVSADGNGGRLMLAGPNVTNAGSLVAPSGQVILAAGLQVGVDAHQSSDASLRGLDVYVGNVGTYAGTTTNNGLIEIMRGSASLSGKVVNHTGAIESSTSVSLNGRIDISANYNAVPNPGYDATNTTTGTPWLFQSTGAVSLGAGSLLRILPEIGSAEKAVGTQLALRSQINLQGKTIYLGPDAHIFSPNALVSIKAGNWFYNPSVIPPTSTFVTTGGQVYLDRRAAINVAGSTGVTAPLSQVILSLVLRSGELAPAPLQRNSVLRGPTLTVDLRNTGIYNGRRWVGTPLADLTGYPGLVERTAGELTVAGGSVDISAGGSVVLQRESSINVSGGHLEYLGGTVKTSRLFSDGHLIDIRDATPDRVYSGIFTGTSDEVHPRWGITNTYNLSLAPTGEHYEPLTLSGADAGSISLAAPSQVLDGVLTGITSPGPRQLRATSNTSSLPRAGSLMLTFSGQEIRNNAPAANFPAPPDITFNNGTQGSPGSFSPDDSGNPALLAEDRIRRVLLSPKLTTTHGFLNLTINNEGGNITVPRGITLQGRPGGSFRFLGSNVSILGKVIAPGGVLAMEALNLTAYETLLIQELDPSDPRRALPPPNPNRGIFTLGRGATLTTAGLLVDDRLNALAPFSRPARLAGGSISIKGYTADLAAGSVIDVSGGVLMDPRGHRTYGNGGSIEIEAGQDPRLNGLVGGKLRLGSTLLGYSGARAGSLAITAPLIQIGGGALHPDTLLLQPRFFSTGGFGRFDLTGLGVVDASGRTLPAVYLTPGTRLAPIAGGLVAIPNPQGDGLTTRIVQAPAGVRTPVSFGFHAPGVEDGIAGGQLIRGDVLFGQGSLIRTDPLAGVSLSGQTVAVLGSIFAPAGQISISGTRNSSSVFQDPTAARTTVYLGPQVRLSTAGTLLLLPDAYGRRIGSVLPGGSISVSGNILAAPGAVLDVSGSSGFLDLHPATVRPLLTYSIPPGSGLTEVLGSLAVERTRVDSSGGSISLSGGQFLYPDATLLGHAGGPTALGGTLSVSSGRFYPPNTVAPPTDTNLVVRQSGPVIPAGYTGSGNPIGQLVPDAINRGYFSADSFTQGGFDSLVLGGNVGFDGRVSLTGRGFLRIANGGIVFANDTVELTAPYVALGRDFTAPARPEDLVSPFAAAFAPTPGTGRLMVNASQIDIGTLSLQGISQAVLTALNGDIRGNGTFNIAGDLTLRAGQVYPTTAAPFYVIAYDYTLAGQSRQGSITIEASGSRDLPLSGGGALGIYASHIRQDGVLRAPLGSITLGWDGTGTPPRDLIAGNTIAFPVTQDVRLGTGSITSVSAVDPRTGRGILIPYGVSPDGLTWIDPRGVDITAGGLPEKQINIAGRNVAFAPGANIDLRGGGDLFAYRFVEGNGGPEDILASNDSFAIVPGFESGLAPYAPFNALPTATNLIRDFGPGYVNSHVHAGDRIFIQGSRTLRAGYYTLLPARYALLPGGVLRRSPPVRFLCPSHTRRRCKSCRKNSFCGRA